MSCLVIDLRRLIVFIGRCLFHQVRVSYQRFLPKSTNGFDKSNRQVERDCTETFQEVFFLILP